LSVPVQLIAWKDSSLNDLLCFEWDVKPYTLTHSLSPAELKSYLVCAAAAVTRSEGERPVYGVEDHRIDDVIVPRSRRRGSPAAVTWCKDPGGRQAG